MENLRLGTQVQVSFRYHIFKSYFFFSLTFPISLSDFTIELLSKNLKKIGKIIDKKKSDIKI